MSGSGGPTEIPAQRRREPLPASNGNPERFDPEEHGGRLMEAEHRGRYWWAAQIADGEDVLDAGCGTGYGMAMLAAAGADSVSGVDIDPEAVAGARSRCGDSVEVREADIRSLPFEAGSFDLVVCWETIEHVEEGERAIAEFHRVLRPGGVLLISSPNPAVYPPGNEHHVHEYPPRELAALVGERFANVHRHRQHPWLASAIEPADDSSLNGHENGRRETEIHATHSLQEGQETYGIVAASDGPLPSLQGLLVLGGDFEVRWWVDQLQASGNATVEAVARVEVEAQRLLAEAASREEAVRSRLDETAHALYEANQALAQIPALHHHVAQAQAETEALRAMYERSRSWRLTAPLRQLGARLRRRR
jgi:SAM-dependent methyltransferase